MKKLKIIILVFSIVIIFIIGTIVLLKNDNMKFIQEGGIVEEIVTDANRQEEKSNNIIDAKSFFTVSSCVSQYIDLLNQNNDIYYGYDEDNNYTKITNPYENILKLLSQTYIKENNISKDTIQNHIQLLENKVMFIPIQMKVIKNTNIQKYLVYGILESLDNKYISDIYLFVNLCETNHTFSVEPIKNKYDNIHDINYTNKEEIIDPNSYNEYISVAINDEYICKQYLNIYKNIALVKPELAYQFLDEEYRNKRFGDVSSYIKYVRDNEKDLKILKLSEYQINRNDEFIEYVCKDSYENLYIFKETANMDFSLKLDTYTIPTDKFIKTYTSAKENKKVMMNIDKWVQMLNSRDYTTAYQVLDETFRSNNFGSEEKFDRYMRRKYPLHYEIKFSNFSKEGATYIQHITLVDITSKSEEKEELDIIMKLKEGTDFVMSFSIE